MISTVKKLAKASVELPILKSRAMGVGFIESQIAKQVGSVAIAKIITKAFGLKSVDKKEQAAARKKLKEEYGTNPRLESMFGGGGFGGFDDDTGTNKISKKINEIKKILVGMAEEIASISKKLDAIGDQNNQILKAAQSRLAQEVGKIMENAPVPTPEPLPAGTTKSEGGIIVPQEKEKIVEKTIVEKESSPDVPALNTTPQADTTEEPTAVPKKKDTLIQTIVQQSINKFINKFPMLKAVLSKSNEQSTSSEAKSSSSTIPLVDADENIQPALEGIAEKKPIQSQIEPDELQELLKKSLKEAFEELKNENPELFQSSGGGVLDTVLGVGKNLISGGVAATAATVAGVATAATAVTGGIAYAMDQSMKSGADKEITKIIEKGSASDVATALQAGTPQQKAYKLQEFEKAAANNPELATKLSQAKQLAGMPPTTGAQQQTPPKPEGGAQLSPATPQTATPAPQSSSQLSRPEQPSVGTDIIEMNRALRSSRTETSATQQKPSVIQRITNNNMALPKQEKKENIEVGNKENTFNRLIAQDFDHPAAYSTFNMG